MDGFVITRYFLLVLFAFGRAEVPKLSKFSVNEVDTFYVSVHEANPITKLYAEHYNVDKDQISVSGLSSGGYFAVQFHVAFSKVIMGAGIIAAGGCISVM